MKQSSLSSPVRRVTFGAPDVDEKEIEEVVACLRGGWLGTGPLAERLENNFKSYKGARHAVAVSSCTAALHLSLLASRVQPGEEIITSALTFSGTVNAIIHSGAKPVLADVNPRTMTLDPRDVESKITRKTRAILPVHFAGRSCEMDEICSIADRHRLTLIEDCAHAIETEYKGRKAGTMGDFGCFSFSVGKNVTSGEGGMILTNDSEVANRIRILASHGMTRNAWNRIGGETFEHYSVVECGYRYNMIDLLAAIGIHQLSRVETHWKRRREIWRTYNESLTGLPLRLPPEAMPDSRHAFHLYTILLDEDGIPRDTFVNRMTQEAIGVGIHYLGIPEHPYYRRTFGWRPEDYPNSESIGRQTVSLPLSPGMTDPDVEQVVRAVRRILGARVSSKTRSPSRQGGSCDA